MKNGLTNVIYALGILMLVGAGVIGIIVGVLFAFPNANFFGAKSVNERDTQIVYGDETLDNAFASGKLILESTGAQIEVKMSNAGYEGEGTIVVNESATGVAFNSLSRTLVEWTQTTYNSEIYYRIKVLEPYGFVFNKKTTTVYINLPHRDPSANFTHNFVLQNGYSNVNFSMVDETEDNVSDMLKIDNLIVENALAVNIKSATNISLNSLTIKSNNTKVNCQAEISGNVQVKGANGTQTFNSEISGSVTITGEKNNFHGDKSGNLTFNAVSGVLSMNQIAGLNVTTKNANVSVNQVDSGVNMSTENGNLKVGKVTSGGVVFTAGTPSSPTATASIEISSELNGSVNIRNYGVGRINLKGVDGNVDIQSCQVNGKQIDVKFKDSASGCTAQIIGYDGDINVRGINGWVNIEVFGHFERAGMANINAQFNHVVSKSGDNTASCIWTGAYISGHDKFGNTNIELASSAKDFDLYVYGARSARYKGSDINIIDSGELSPAPSHGTGSNNDALEVHCQNKVIAR